MFFVYRNAAKNLQGPGFTLIAYTWFRRAFRGLSEKSCMARISGGLVSVAPSSAAAVRPNVHGFPREARMVPDPFAKLMVIGEQGWVNDPLIEQLT